MRKMTLVLALVAASFAVNAQSGVRNNAIKLNPLSLFLLTGNVAYERAVGPTQSFQVGVFYSGLTISDLKYSGLGITPEYRFYVAGRKEALNGLYVAPYARYQSFNFKDKNTQDKASLSSFGGGALLGWQKMWDGGFTLDLFAGPGYNAGNVKYDDQTENEFDVKGGIDGFGVRAGITLGIGF
jgi:hypothetical protein